MRASEARLKAATDLVGLSSYTWQPATGALEWDSRLKAMWGLSPDAHVDHALWLSAIHPADKPKVEAALAACLDPAGDGVYRVEYRVIGIEDGIERWVSTYGRTTFFAGEPVDFIGAVIDVTERRQVEEALRQSQEQFRLFAEHTTNVLWMVDAATDHIEYLSPALDRSWGVSRIAMVGPRSKWLDITHPDDRHVVETAYQRAKLGEASTVEYRLLRPDGSLRAVRDTFFPVRERGTDIERVAGIAQDITPENGRHVYLVATDEDVASTLRLSMREGGYDIKQFRSARIFLQVAPVLSPGCILLALGANEAEDFEILNDLKSRRTELPIVVIGDAHSEIELAVRTMRAGAVDFLQGSADLARLQRAVAAALVQVDEGAQQDRFVSAARARIAELSARERDVLEKFVAGGTNKTMARELGLSPRTVEAHRARVMERLGATTVQEAVLMAAAAGIGISSSKRFK